MRLLPPTHLAALVAAATSALAFAPGPAWAQPLPSSVVAYTGQVAPGTGGATSHDASPRFRRRSPPS